MAKSNAAEAINDTYERLLSGVATCRFCGESDYRYHRGGGFNLWKYGVRHYAHASCGLRVKGAAFLGLFHAWQLKQFPALVAAEFGLFEELQRLASAAEVP